MEYPEQVKEDKLLKYLYDTGGGGYLYFKYLPRNQKSPFRRSVKREAGIYLGDKEEVSRKLGFTPHEFDTVFRRLSNGGYKCNMEV
jgi:hypothetical protein